MKRVKVYREPSTPQGTFGAIAILDDELRPENWWHSLELPWKGNRKGLSCVPPAPDAGTIVYRAQLLPASPWSPRSDGRLYHVVGIPGRDGVEIHAATWAGDVEAHYYSELLGCLTLGKERGYLAPRTTGRLQACVLRSRVALGEFMNELDGEDFEIEIAWERAAFLDAEPEPVS